MRKLTTLALGLVCLTGLPAAVSAQVGQGLFDPNAATEAQLASVPHLTPSLVKAIQAGRPFLSAMALDALLGKTLSKEQRTAVYGKLFVHVNLNTASKDEILLIPGVGNRMAHEFEEYRPYKAMAQFRREIAKYVDAKELARLESYSFVPIDLNTASDEDIMTIPGLGRRMLHEFKEYRPYKAIEQFRREMGKYVDKNEVARLERYVVIN